MTIHLVPYWPFVESGGTREARRRLEQAQATRPEVARLVSELDELRMRNHFADALRRAFEAEEGPPHERR